MATQIQEQEQREKLLSIDQTQREVILPKLKEIAETVIIIANKEYITRTEADQKYVLKTDFALIKRITYTALAAIVTGVVGFVFLVIQSNLK